MSLERISDDSLLVLYESIRQQADADRGNKRHFTASPNIRDRAAKLREEMIKRGVPHSPIDWPTPN